MDPTDQLAEIAGITCRCERCIVLRAQVVDTLLDRILAEREAASEPPC